MKNSKLKQKGANTRARISQSAAQILDERGYFGTGMNEILSRADAPKGSMYFHFPGGKEEVATSAIQLAAEEITALLTATLENESNSEKAIATIFTYFRQRLISGEFKCGCPISTTGLELSGSDSPVLEACGEAYASWMSVLENFLNQFLPKPKSHELTNTIFCLVQGSLLMSRITGDICHLNHAEIQCITLLHTAIMDV